MKPESWKRWQAALVVIVASHVFAADYHVDAVNGDDAADGLSAATAWRSLARVNAADFKPGDRVAFKRGGVWRGQLVPQSGAENLPVTYGAYGEGPRPRLLGSVSMNRPEDWQDEGGKRWSTRADPVEQPIDVALGAARWSLHTEGGARVEKSTTAEGALVLKAQGAGTAGHQVQLFVAGLSIEQGRHYVLEFRVRCDRAFSLSRVVMSKATSPWTSYAQGAAPRIEVGPAWTVAKVAFLATQSATDARITLHLGGALPEGAAFEFLPVAWKQRTYPHGEPLPCDVGNIIFDGGPRCGVKKWKVEDLARPGDFVYAATEGRVTLFSEGNPAEQAKSIELALSRHIVSEGGRHHVTYEDLDLRYGAAHGIGGGDTHHITVRRCDISFIGGGHQFTRPDGKPVRYGNGVEFWAAAHDNLVEACRIWEIYDAALTNQGDDHNEERSIVYRNNVIWHAEYSFEYWNRKNSVTRDILFEHNTCYGAGRGWGHGQRPDPNGRHLMFYQNSADTRGVVVRNNLFSEATESGLRMENDWTAGLASEHNGWFQSQGTSMRYLGTTYAQDQFEAFRKASGLERGSIVADPRFVNPAAGDFRLAPGSPMATLATDGGPAGSRERLRE